MPMNPTLVFNQSVAANATSSEFTCTLEPDAFGFIAVSHSGAKFASGDTVAVSLEATHNGTDWFVVETMLPRDTDYLNQTGDAPSWFRIVPVVATMRLRVNNGASRTYKVWISE